MIAHELLPILFRFLREAEPPSACRENCTGLSSSPLTITAHTDAGVASLVVYVFWSKLMVTSVEEEKRTQV